MKKCIFKKASDCLNDKPELLIGFGLAGFMTSTVMACQATVKANEMVKEMEEEKGEELTNKELILATAHCYIPSAISFTVSTIAIFGAVNILNKKNAMLAMSACSMAENLRIYADKTKEVFGEEGAKKIREEVSREKVRTTYSQAPKEEIIDGQVVINDDDNILCLDALTGIYFRSNKTKLKEVETLLNRRMINEGYLLLNEFYEELGLKDNALGKMLGWHIDTGYIELAFDSELLDDGRPVLVVNHYVMPRVI